MFYRFYLHLIRAKSQNVFPVGEQEQDFMPKFWSEAGFSRIDFFVKALAKFLEKWVRYAPQQGREDDSKGSLNFQIHFLLFLHIKMKNQMLSLFWKRDTIFLWGHNLEEEITLGKAAAAISKHDTYMNQSQSLFKNSSKLRFCGSRQK